MNSEKLPPFVDELNSRRNGDFTQESIYQTGHIIVLSQPSSTENLVDLGFGGCCQSVSYEFSRAKINIELLLHPKFSIDFNDESNREGWPSAVVSIMGRKYVKLKSTLPVPKSVDFYQEFQNGLDFRESGKQSSLTDKKGHKVPVVYGKGATQNSYIMYCAQVDFGNPYPEFKEPLPFNKKYCVYEKKGMSAEEHFQQWLNTRDPEGTLYGVDFVHEAFALYFNDLVDRKIATEDVPDYHPFSNHTVRDIVHPALYAYEAGVSHVSDSFVEPVDNLGKKLTFDRWGRRYEDSKHQWLPTYFQISNKRSCCKIDGYINGLDKTADAELYSAIERLFVRFIPSFEDVLTYANECDFYLGLPESDSDTDEEENSTATEDKEVNSTATEDKEVYLDEVDVQVITKIVDYELKPGQSYEGVWHVEGMSHEHIVATGVWVSQRDRAITGGEIVFKRAPTYEEVEELQLNNWESPVRERVEGHLEIPLGKIGTSEGSAVVFPNCHIHKVRKMTNTSQTETAKRRIVVFFLVDPEVRIVSTREVPDQRSSLSLEEAKERRLRLMEERKYHKQTLNLRSINLCEH